MCDLLTDDGRLVELEILAEYSCMVDDTLRLGWLIDSDNQYLAPDGTWRQILTEKSMIPVSTRKESAHLGDGESDSLELLDNDVFKLAAEDAVADQFRKADQNSLLDKLQWIVSVVCGTFLILGTMVWIGGC